jgi:hypothetical protein
MASLFALGVMSIIWMALIAALIAIEKTIPWRRVATYALTAVLLTLGVSLLTASHAIPALTIPTSSMQDVRPTGQVSGTDTPHGPRHPGSEALGAVRADSTSVEG